MTFSAKVKEELSKINNLAKKELVKWEIIGYFVSANSKVMKKQIKYATENEYNINRFGKLLHNLGMDYQIAMHGNSYVISFLKDPILEKIPEIKIEEKEKICWILPEEMLQNPEQKQEIWKALVRGAFLGAGSLNEPTKKYHLEIILNTEETAKIIQEALAMFSINVKRLTKKKGTSLYLKEGEEISKLLAFIGASQAVLKYEEIRVMRDTRNTINRLVNCETANMNKTIDAALQQIEAIRYLKKIKKFEELPDNLKEIAELRCKNPDATLVELGQMLVNPVGKSGVNHRLQKIQEIAKELKG